MVLALPREALTNIEIWKFGARLRFRTILPGQLSLIEISCYSLLSACQSFLSFTTAGPAEQSFGILFRFPADQSKAGAQFWKLINAASKP